MKQIVLSCLLLFSCVGCYQGSSNGEDQLITTPTTNNPQLVPEGGGISLPGAMPY